MTPTEIHFNETVRHHIDVLRYGQTLSDDMVADDQQGQTIAAGTLLLLLSGRRYNPEQAQQIIQLRGERLEVMLAEFLTEMETFAADEASRQVTLLRRLVDRSIIQAGESTISAVVLQAFGLGTTIKEMFEDIIRRERVQLSRLVRAVRSGKLDATANIAAIFNQTSHELAAIPRTTITHVSNSAAEAILAQNSDIVRALQWSSILDTRTSAVCWSRHGKMVPIGNNKLPDGAEALNPPASRPPAHPNCRSVMVVVFVGDKPPENLSADAWLRRQPAAFQDVALGPTRGALFRRGDLDLNAFIDTTGRRLNLTELRAREPFAFDRANLNPESRR